MILLAIGDVVGRPGRRAITEALPQLMESYKPDLVVMNAENASGGAGITLETAAALYAAGADVLTMGNHVWNNRQSYEYIDAETRLVRPANFPSGAPGRGWGVYEARDGTRLGVVNLQGRTFMQAIDDPFRAGEAALEDLRGKCDAVVVDFHAEATSEKMAFAWHVDGQAAAVWGTHTHVPTADERLLPGGTAYISDLGMTGPYDSIIGMNPDGIIGRFLSGMPVRFEVAKGSAILNGAVIDIDGESGLAKSIERVSRFVR